MHVLLVIVGGIVQLGIFLLFGWLWSSNAAVMILAAKIFVLLWFAVVVVNMAVGVIYAGYSARDELLIMLLNFVVPGAVAALAIWNLSRG